MNGNERKILILPFRILNIILFGRNPSSLVMYNDTAITKPKTAEKIKQKNIICNVLIIAGRIILPIISLQGMSLILTPFILI
jgi:hypothetical protein